MVGNYKVITLCGSTKFKDKFMEVQKDLTLKGNIVISVGCFGHSGDVFTDDQKTMLDDMHKRKIDMADEIFVINADNYIGSSTRSEILYALSMNKKVNFLEDRDIIATYNKLFYQCIDHQMNGKFIKAEMKIQDLDSEDKNLRSYVDLCNSLLPSNLQIHYLSDLTIEQIKDYTAKYDALLTGKANNLVEKEDNTPPYNEDMHVISKKEDKNRGMLPITLDGPGMYISEKEDDTYHHNEETLSFNFVNEFIDNL